MKRIGLIGGTSPESTLYYYHNFIEISRKRFERDFYPEIVIFSLNFKEFRRLPNWEEKKRYIMEGIHALECSGVEVIGLAANTPHIIFNELQKDTRVKMVSIIDAVAEEAKRMGFRKLLLLGTKTTMTSEFYVAGLKKHDLNVVIPKNNEIEEVNRIIFKELSLGYMGSKEYLIDLVNRYSQSVDAAILGCTELPLAIKDGDTKIPLLDSARIHVNALLAEALKT